MWSCEGETYKKYEELGSWEGGKVRVRVRVTLDGGAKKSALQRGERMVRETQERRTEMIGWIISKTEEIPPNDAM